MSAAPLPPAPIPADASLQHFAEMPMDFVRLRASTLAATGDPADNWFALLLWGAAWHQVPAGSLPDDDAQLAYLAGLGRDVRAWRKRRTGALRGWVKHDDGRLYHSVVTEKVVAALETSRKGKAAITARWEKEKAAREAQVAENKQNEEYERNTATAPNVIPRSDLIGSDLNPSPDGDDEATTPGDQKPDRTKAKRATRIPDDWKLTADQHDAALAARPDVDPDRESDRFRAYWLGASKNATSPDWTAKWRYWLTNAHPTPGFIPPREQNLLDASPRAADTRDEAQYRARVTGWLADGGWNENQWGPAPDHPNTRVPPRILDELGIQPKRAA